MGLLIRLRRQKKFVTLEAPAAINAGPCVTAVMAELLTLSETVVLSWLAANVNATVGETVPKLRTTLPVNSNPEVALVVALPVKTDKNPSTLERSLNSQLEIAKF